METESTPRRDREEDNLISSQTTKRSKTCVCLATTIVVIVVLGLLILILALTVFKAKKPEMDVKSVSLRDLDFDISRLKFTLNISLDLDISVKNPNRVGFRYNNSTAYLRYKGTDVGEVPLIEDEVGARDTHDLKLTLTLMADRLLSNLSFYSDVVSESGSLPFQTYVRISGRVKILFVKFHVVSYTTCDVNVYTSNRSVSDPTCRYKTKL